MRSLPAEWCYRARVKVAVAERSQGYVPAEVRFKRFGERYYDRFDLFFDEIVEWPRGGYAPYQREIAQATIEHGRVATRGLRGFGKTTTLAGVAMAFALTREALGIDWKVITITSVWRQNTYYLWPEIHKTISLLRWNKIGRPPFRENQEILTQRLRLDHGQAFPVSTKQGATSEGGHADEILILCDEAKIIPVPVWNSVIGMGSSTGKFYWLAASTPGEPAGYFYDIMSGKMSRWWTRKVSAEEAIEAGRVDPNWVAEMTELLEIKKITQAFYDQQVKGDFGEETGGDKVIPLSRIEYANAQWEAWNKEGTLTSIGVDVGQGEEGDATAIALVYDRRKVKEIRKMQHFSDPDIATMTVVGEVMGILAKDNGRPLVAVDVIGLGAGVYHRLVELGVAAIPFNSSSRTDMRDESGERGFTNWRSAGWWLLREAMNPKSGIGICLPEDDDLKAELIAPSHRTVSVGNIQIEGKESLRKANSLGHSPNCADAVIYGLIGPVLHQERMEAERGGEMVIEYDPVLVGPQI